MFDLDMTGLHLASDAMEKLLKIDTRQWLEELKGVKEFFQQFKKDLPKELWNEYEELVKRLK
jgi:phosphoenolpyruvate carboxykinase (GTP)